MKETIVTTPYSGFIVSFYLFSLSVDMHSYYQNHRYGEGKSRHIMALVILAEVILFHSALRSQDRLNF